MPMCGFVSILFFCFFGLISVPAAMPNCVDCYTFIIYFCIWYIPVLLLFFFFVKSIVAISKWKEYYLMVFEIWKIKNLHMNIYRCFMYITKTGNTSKSTNMWINEQVVVYNAILLCNKNEQIALYKHYGYILKTLCWAKEARHIRIHTLCFYLYEVLEHAKLI